MAHCWGGKMVDALKAVCELQLDFNSKAMPVVQLGHTWKFSDGAIPDFEAIFAGASKSKQDEIHDILVHQSKPGIVEVGVFFELERRLERVGGIAEIHENGANSISNGSAGIGTQVRYDVHFE